MKKLTYETITGRRLDLSDIKAAEHRFLADVRAMYETRPEWTAFASWWMAELERSGLAPESVACRVCDDLEARLGIAQGKVAPPDYRDYLADLIEERYGSRYQFCKDTGIDPGHLSRVLANRADLSLSLLKRIMTVLHAALIIQTEERLLEQLSPDEAARALAAATAG